MKVILQVNGQMRSFSEKELRAKLEILEELERHFVKERHVDRIYEIARKPAEGKCFKVNPMAIDENLFKEKRDDSRQEWVRELIIKALHEVKKNPHRYEKTFVTMIPEKKWDIKTVEEVKRIAKEKGNHMADWVEQSLEWAQRIVNGESWQALCNEPDNSNWYRLILWENDHARIVGGSRKSNDHLPAATIFGNHSYSDDVLKYTVPLIVIYL